MFERSAAKERVALILVLYATSLGVRLSIWDIAPYGDEGFQYLLARQGDAEPPRLEHVDGEPWFEGTHYWWQRPLFSILLMPGALLGFQAFRLEHIALASGLAPAAYVLMSVIRVRLMFSLPAAAVLAFHPHFLVWTTLAIPDATATAVLLVGLTLLALRRRIAGVAALVAACWLKESVLMIYAALVLLAAVRRPRGTFVEGLDARSLATGLGLATLPLVLFLAQGGPIPGGYRSAGIGQMIDMLFLSVWLLVPILAGLAWTHTRPWALLGLLLPALYISGQLVLGRSVEVWYATTPAALAVVAAAAAFDESDRKFCPAPKRRIGAAATAVAMALIFVVAAMAPASEWKRQAVTPLSPAAGSSLVNTIGYERSRGIELRETLAEIEGRESVFFVDVYMGLLGHPFDSASPRGWYAFSYRNDFDRWRETARPDLERWAVTIEQGANVTVVAVVPFAANEAVRDTYSACSIAENAAFVVLEGARCLGRVDALVRAFDARRAAT